MILLRQNLASCFKSLSTKKFILAFSQFSSWFIVSVIITNSCVWENVLLSESSSSASSYTSDFNKRLLSTYICKCVCVCVCVRHGGRGLRLNWPLGVSSQVRCSETCSSTCSANPKCMKTPLWAPSSCTTTTTTSLSRWRSEGSTSCPLLLHLPPSLWFINLPFLWIMDNVDNN